MGVVVTPVRLRLHGQSTPRPSYRIYASVFGGMLPFMSVFDSENKPSPKKATKKASKRKKEKKQRRFFKVGRVVPAVPDLIAGILHTIHFEHLFFDGEFGLPDPADTGQLYGHLTPLLFGASWSPAISISLRPDFNRTHLSGKLDTALRITPAALLPPVVRFAWRAMFGTENELCFG